MRRPAWQHMIDLHRGQAGNQTHPPGSECAPVRAVTAGQLEKGGKEVQLNELYSDARLLT